MKNDFLRLHRIDNCEQIRLLQSGRSSPNWVSIFSVAFAFQETTEARQNFTFSRSDLFPQFVKGREPTIAAPVGREDIALFRVPTRNHLGIDPWARGVASRTKEEVGPRDFFFHGNSFGD
jgi:hypothetical protein